jgi:hypothetical protein
MATTAFIDIPTAYQGINDFIISDGAKLSYGLKTAVTEFHGSPVDRMVNVCEALYANRATTSMAGKELCAQLAGFCTANGFHVLGSTSRGAEIVQATRRDLGQTVSQKPEEDPVPLEKFV